MAIPVITGGGPNSDKVTGEEGVAFDYQIVASGSPTGYGCVPEPDGLAVNDISGEITGTPTADAIGTTIATMSATNADGTGELTLKFFISPAGTPLITSSLWDTGESDGAYSYQITASHTPITMYGASGLPAGISLDPATGIISGTLGHATSDVTIIYAVRAENATGLGAAAQVSLVITGSGGGGGGGGGNKPHITSSLTDTGTVGDDYTYTITADNTPTSFIAQSLPDGLSLDSVTGIISGVPTTPGDYDVGLRGVNEFGPGPISDLVLHIDDASGGGGGVPTITSDTTINVQAGVVYYYQITATNDPTSYDFVLSAGGTANVDTSTGEVNLRFQSAGTTSAVASATNGSGTGMASITIIVSLESTDTTPPPINIAGDGLYAEYNTFAEDVADPCEEEDAIVSDLPDPPRNLVVTTPGDPSSGQATATWDPPING